MNVHRHPTPLAVGSQAEVVTMEIDAGLENAVANAVEVVVEMTRIEITTADGMMTDAVTTPVTTIAVIATMIATTGGATMIDVVTMDVTTTAATEPVFLVGTRVLCLVFQCDGVHVR